MAFGLATIDAGDPQRRLAPRAVNCPPVDTSDDPKTPESVIAARRLALALELSQTAMSLMRQNLRRRDPDADDATIEARFHRWLASGGRHPESHFRIRADLR